jgi:sodium transport system permease protein
VSLRVVGTVWGKELRETLRDRRTIFVMIALPLLLYPVVGIIGAQAVTANQASREVAPARIAVEGGGALGARLRATLARSDRLALRPGGRAELARRAVGAVVVLPGDADARLAAGERVKVTILTDEADDDAQLAAGRLREALAAFARAEAEAALRARGLPPALADPIEITTHNVAPQARMGGYLLSLILPMVTVLVVILGAFYPAIDVTAGEKERGTLETILCAPIARRDLILGKFLCVATLAFTAAVLNLVSMALTGVTILHAALADAQVPWRVLPLVLAALVPATLLFSALMLAVAALARSFKEAQNALTPVYLICVIPAMIATLLPGLHLGWLTALVPAVNVSLLVKDLIRGEAAPGPAVLACAVTLGYAAAALRLAALIYDSERLLFAVEGGRRLAWPWRRAGRVAPRLGPLEPAEAMMLVGVALVLLALVGSRLQARWLVPGLLATEWLLVFGTVVVYLRAAGVAAGPALGLARPRVGAVVGAVLAGASGWYLVATLVEPLMEHALPVPRELVEQLGRLVGTRPLWVELLVMAVTPAVCEEVLFRGALQRSLAPRLGSARAVVLTAVAFGLFHLSIYRFVPTTLLGVVLGVIAQRSRSLWPAIVFHATSNAAIVVLARFVQSERMPADGRLVVVAALTLVAGLWLAGLGVRRKKVDPV